jgi:LytS/YehU family sensor histidine kinase
MLGVTKKEKFFYYYCNTIQISIAALVAIYSFVMITAAPEIKFIFLIRQLTTILSALAFFPVLVLLFIRSAKNKLARIILFGAGFIFVGAITMIYLNRVLPNLEHSYFAPVTYLEIGALAEVMILGLALGYKANIIKKEKESFRQKIVETEIAALKAQMNPHFMFNCINSIDAFIQSNDKYNATLYLNKFAKLIRNVLDSSKQNLVHFSKDIETLKLYIELEELRHENKFTTEIKIEPELLSGDYKVLPLIIQPFVENAILHGLKNKDGNNGKLFIDVKRNSNNIDYTITDNGIGRKAAVGITQNKESSYGMQLSFDRIKLFNEEKTPSVKINDLYEGGIATGTKVNVLLKIV